MAEIFLGLKATVSGAEEIKKLNKALKHVREEGVSIGQMENIVRKRRKLNTIEITRQAQMTEILITKDKKKNWLNAEARFLLERRNYELKEHNATMLRAVWIDKQYKLGMDESIVAAKAMLAAEKQLEIQEKLDLERKKALIIAEKAKRRELMQASIGMFVMGITMTQTLDTMGKMAGQGTALEAVFKDMSQGVRLMLGPIQVLTSAMQFLNMENRALMLTMGRTMLIFAGAYILWRAFTTQTKELRFVLGLLGGALITLNALYLIQTKRIWAKIYATIMNLSVSSLGAALPQIAFAIGVGTALGFAAMASAPKGQTAPGYSRPVTDSGLVYAHRGETISRIGSMEPQMASGMTVNFFVPENSVVSTEMIDYLTGELEIINASGRGG